MSNLWEGFLGNIILLVVSSLITIAVSVYVLRKQLRVQIARYRHEDEQAAKKEEAERKQAVIRAIDPLYKDLGTLAHLCNSMQYEEMLKHIRSMNERQQRGEYDLSSVSQPLQQYWRSVHEFLRSYSMNAHYAYFTEPNARNFMRTQISSFAQMLQHTLEVAKR